MIDIMDEEELLFSEHHACPIVVFRLKSWSRECFPLTVHLELVLIVMDLVEA